MRYTITGRNIDVTPGLREAVIEKIGKLERYFNQDTEAIITLSVTKDRQKIEVTIPVKGHIIRAEEQSTDMYVSIEFYIQEETEADDEIKIEKVKRFAMKPMDPEEACVQMELLGHSFYVFLNAETEEVNVVYKRKGQTYGLIEPEF